MKRGSNSLAVLWPIFVLPWLLGGCASISERPATAPPGSQSDVSHGYALLFDLLGDEQNVSKLLIIKRERPQLRILVKEISRTCGEARKQLEASARAAPKLDLKDQGLPAAEVETRKSIGKAKGKELLTDKGSQFELRLLLSQDEALMYGTHLAATNAWMEGDPGRAQFLLQLSRDLGQLHAKVMAMLKENYSWSSPH